MTASECLQLAITIGGWVFAFLIARKVGVRLDEQDSDWLELECRVDRLESREAAK